MVMTHLLVINANSTGMTTIKNILKLGYEISYIESSAFKEYAETDENKKIKASINNIYYLEDTDDPVKLINLSKDINKKNKIDGIVCVSEYTMESAAAVAEFFGLPFPSYSAIVNSRNKGKTRKILDVNGIHNAKFREVKSWDELLNASNDIGFPLVIKPKTSGNSAGTAIVQDSSSLLNSWNSIQYKVENSQEKWRKQYLRGFLVEEYICGKMVSVEVVHDGATPVVFMISGRERSKSDELIEYRIDMPAKISPQEWQLCENYTLSIVNAVGLSHGIFHIELMITSEGPILVEINPRIMGSYMPFLYQNLTHSNISEWLALIHTGEKLKGNIPSPKNIDKVASSIRFDVISEGKYIPKLFKNYVLDTFEPIYVELQDCEYVQMVKPGDTIGRIQIIFKDHETLQNSLENFFAHIKNELNLELRH